jgi:hypothetical protein
MGTENTDLTGMLAKLEAMKGALEQSIAGLRNLIALGGGSGQIGDIPMANGVSIPTGLLSSGGDTSVPAGAFLGKSIPEAAELYLAIVKGKRTSKEIADALRKGGVESKSQNFTQNVHSGLDRARKTPNSGIVKLDRSHWGLRTWYPAGIGVGVSGGKRNQKKKGARKAKTSGSPALATIEGPTKKANERAMDFLRSGKKAEYGLIDVSGHLGMGMQGTRLILGKLVKAGKVEKTANQSYRIAQPKLVAASL